MLLTLENENLGELKSNNIDILESLKDFTTIELIQL